MKKLIFTFTFLSLITQGLGAQRIPIPLAAVTAFNQTREARDTTKSWFPSWGTGEGDAASVEARMEADATQSLHLQDPYDPNCPFQNKDISCLNVSDGSNLLKNLESDLKVCDCLSVRFKVPAVTPPAEGTAAARERERKLNEGKFLASLMQFAKVFTARRDALLLESHLISGEETRKLSRIHLTKEAKLTIDGLIKSFEGKVSKEFLEKSANAALNSFKKEGRGAAKGTNSDTVLKYLNDKTKGAESCFPYSEYLRVTMIPESNDFWQDLLNNQELVNEKAWDYYDLTTRYKEASLAEKKVIKAKLDFLNRNPSLKTIFNSNDQNLKKEVYRDMRKTLSPSSQCIQAKNCRGSFFASGKNLQNSLKKYYDRPEIKDNHVGSSFVEVLKDISVIGFDQSKEPSLPALRLAFSSDDVRYKECDRNADEEIAPKCSDIFEQYCGEIRSRKGEFRQSFANARNDIYDEGWIDGLEVEAEDSEGYLEFQDKMCDKLARKKNFFSSQVVNFKSYKDEYCQKNNCDSLSDSDIFKIFIKDTSPLDQFFDNDNKLVDGASDFALLAKASSENKTGFDEMDEEFIASIQSISTTTASTAQSNGRNKSNSLNSELSIMDLFSDSKNQAKLDQLDKNKSGMFDEEPYIADIVDYATEDSEGDFLADGIGFDAPPQAFLNNNFSIDSSAISEARNELEELKKEEEAIQREITEVKNVISSSPSSETNSAMETRLENLEKLLAEKEKSSQNYQNLISKLIDSQQKSSSESEDKKAEPQEIEATAAVESQRKIVNSNLAGRPTIVSDEPNSNQRAPASVENFSTSSSAMGGGGAASVSPGSFSSAASAARSGTKFNGALLSKYGIMVQETPGSVVSVAQETEGGHFSVLGPFRDASNLPLEVSQKAFERFKVNDLSALQELYEDSLEEIDQEVVKIMVSSEDSHETLEFYAIKEDGKVVFQPIRKTKLSDLQNTLSQQ